MPNMTNTPGPDWSKIREYSANFAQEQDLTKFDLVSFERVVKLAARCPWIDMGELQAAILIDLVSNPLRRAIGKGEIDVAPVYGKASLVIEPDPVEETDPVPVTVCHEHQCIADECGCYTDDYCQCGLRYQSSVAGKSCPECDFALV